MAAVEGRDFELTTVERAAADRPRRPARAPRRGARRAAARGGAGAGRLVPLRPRPHPRDALRRPHRHAPRPAARRGGRGAGAHRGERGRAGPPLRRGGVPSAIRPRRWSTPTAPGTRRWPRWPTSAPPTSSTRRCSALDLLPEPDEPPPRRAAAPARTGADAVGRRRGALRPCWPPSSSRGASATPTCSARAALSLGGFGLSPGMVDDDLVAVLEEALERPAARRQRAARAPARAPGRRALLLRHGAAPRGPRPGGAGHRARARRPADAGLRPRPGRTSPPTAPTPPSAAWPGPRSSSRWPTPRATPSSRCARARGRSTSCSSSTTSQAPTWRSRRSTASPPTRATRAPAPTSRCTARGGP